MYNNEGYYKYYFITGTLGTNNIIQLYDLSVFYISEINEAAVINYTLLT